MNLAKLPIVDDRQVVRAWLWIRTLGPTRRSGAVAPLLDLRELREDGSVDPGVEAVQLLEAQEYVYQIDLPGGAAAPVDTDKPEMFVPDPDLGHRGRLRPGLYTGTLRVTFQRDGADLGSASFEVRSAKLDYLRSYRWMLRDIAEVAAEMIMDRFAPSEQAFTIDGARDAATLYQRFAFLRSQIESEDFDSAMHRIMSRPHVVWEETEHRCPPNRGARPDSRMVRGLTAVGLRVPWPGAPPNSALRSLPAWVTTTRTEISLDNGPNRFVRFALERWRSVIADIGAALRAERSSMPVERGLKEVDALLARLDGFLAEELFREVGAMAHFPSGSQVLQKSEGYRHILAMYAQFELAAVLSWPGMEDAYSAGQRNVAWLYECWVYLQLGRVIAGLCGVSFDAGDLLERGPDGMTLTLRTGRRRILSGSVDRLGRSLRLELWFNQTFGSSAAPDGSWTRRLRPDCSLRISSDKQTPTFEPVWVHFDAKYRVDDVRQLFGDVDKEGRMDDGNQANPPDWRPDDLLKMHAYKDAIRRSVGAYVIYPGAGSTAPFREYHELLPGLGAFALRPTESGEAEGADGITNFVGDVVDHLALQLTQHERARFWQNQTYSSRLQPQPNVRAVGFLDRPPADVLVLLAYAKNSAHRAWIAESRLYNLRADPHRGGAIGVEGRELGASLLVVCDDGGRDGRDSIDLYQVIGVPCVLTSTQLSERGYPNPGGDHYLCLTLDALRDDRRPAWLGGELVRRLRDRIAPIAPLGAPVVTTWQHICLEVRR